MSSVKIDVSGFSDFIKDLEDMKKELTQDAINLVDTVSNNHLRRTKQNTPVDTGNLRRRFFKTPVLIKSTSISSTMKNNTEYAVYVEKGHRLVNKNKETVGFLDGKFMVQKSEETAQKELETGVGKLWDKARGNFGK